MQVELASERLLELAAEVEQPIAEIVSFGHLDDHIDVRLREAQGQGQEALGLRYESTNKKVKVVVK